MWQNYWFYNLRILQLMAFKYNGEILKLRLNQTVVGLCILVLLIIRIYTGWSLIRKAHISTEINHVIDYICWICISYPFMTGWIYRQAGQVNLCPGSATYVLWKEPEMSQYMLHAWGNVHDEQFLYMHWKIWVQICEPSRVGYDNPNLFPQGKAFKKTPVYLRKPIWISCSEHVWEKRTEKWRMSTQNKLKENYNQSSGDVWFIWKCSYDLPRKENMVEHLHVYGIHEL